MFIAALLAAGPTAAIQFGQPCDKKTATQIKLRWNGYASEWGMYEVEGCTGVGPKLQLEAGKTYEFIQHHASNWYHPVGFAFIAGGAHTECKDASGNVGECPELDGCKTLGACAEAGLDYEIDGAAANGANLGLDDYEPLFFNSQDWWGAKKFSVKLHIAADVPFTKIYYFCHIHLGMSAEIEISGSTATSPPALRAASLGQETASSAQKIYTDLKAAHQPQIGSFDEQCGTHNTASAASGKPECKNKHFLCGDTGDTYTTCLEAVDCQMHVNMAVSVQSGSSKFATFARQMIPHHQNAVAMAKVLQKHKTTADFPDVAGEEWADGLIRSIINVQNAQIQEMQGWLDSNAGLAKSSSLCYEDGDDGCPSNNQGSGGGGVAEPALPSQG